MLVIFDCDGVLVDSELLSNQALREVLAEIGVTLTLEETMAEFMGRSRAHMLRRTQELLGEPLPYDFGEHYDARRDAAFWQHLEPVEGIEAALDELYDRQIATCVASSGDHEKMRMTLGMTGLYERFEGRIYSATEVANGKPAPDLFLHAATKEGFAPEDCVVVEDSPVGVEAARAAGMRVLGFGEDLDADIVFTDMTELPHLLDG
jgi:HAD superfamily hydrolase (TIGR01509 family)